MWTTLHSSAQSLSPPHNVLVWHCQQGKLPDIAFGQNYQVMSSGDQYSCIQSWTTKKRRKTFTNTPFVAVLAVSRSRLSVATATRSSSEGLNGTLSFLPNGRTSSLPTSKNRVGIRFSVDWECRLLVYCWWQREVTIWGLGRWTIQRHRPQLNRRDEDMGTGFLIWSALCCLSRSRSCSRYLCADNVAIYLHCFCPIDWLLSLFLMNSSFLFAFLPFFVSSFDPLAPQSRFHLNLAKALLASLYMRTTIVLSSSMVS